MTEPVERDAARVLLLDDADRVLLFRYHNLGRDWWACPGGGLEAGETHEDAARRELAEECGLTDVELGPWIWTREHTFPWNDQVLHQRERYFVARVAGFALPASTAAVHEADGISGHRWWDRAALHAGKGLVPANLSRLVDELLAHGPPDPPIDVGA